jgi:steroid 5-alpha reductase family enzyme
MFPNIHASRRPIRASLNAWLPHLPTLAGGANCGWGLALTLSDPLVFGLPRPDTSLRDRMSASKAVLPIVLLIGLGFAWAGSQAGSTVLGMPIFGLCVAVAFLIQWVAFVPAFVLQSEKFFDLVGSLTYLTLVGMALWLSPVRDERSTLLAVLVAVWAARLGTFLFRRVHKTGGDGRFDEIKPSFLRFLTTWTIQGLWVTVTISAALAAITTSVSRELGLFALLGSIAWAVGFVLEVIADAQKSRFRGDPATAGRFIQTGLWAWSRHPNFFGEILLWIGVAIVALPVLRGWQFLTLLSPLFVFLLLTRVSGLPLLEARSDERWGGQPDYEAYKARTPVLVPRPPRN